MPDFAKQGAALPFFLALAACSGAPAPTDAPHTSEPAQLTVIDDVSESTAAHIDPAVAKAAQQRIAGLAGQMQLGDSIIVYEAGARSAERMIAHPAIVTDYNLRIPAAAAKLEQQLQEIAARFDAEGGDDQTNLLLALETIRPSCTPRSTVVLMTDGMEVSDAYSASQALVAGEPVNLPPPPGEYLAGCRVVMLGFGLTIDPSAEAPQILPASMLISLRQAWTAYLQAAGVKPADMTFISAL
ncbi:hypothetical protein [Novosphingobium naphthalenivorans]|uniref:hypothetical protein n=1 Tax=Novosphingobium naphthalenivorans TaxID=273168 RepID=UPI00082F733C|nr:hypothetical protein [Novosphingobium naphthalenivorans]